VADDLQQLTLNDVPADQSRPANEDRRYEIPLFFRHTARKVQDMTKLSTGHVVGAETPNIYPDARGDQPVKPAGDFSTLPTGLGEEDGDRDRNRGIVRDSGGLRGAATKKEGEAEHRNKHNADPSHNLPPPGIVRFA
jgi:hypothetical protein